MSDTRYIVWVDCTDSWDVQDDPDYEDLWVIARDSPTIEEEGLEGLAIYQSKESALHRETCILDHATKITETNVEEIDEGRASSGVFLVRLSGGCVDDCDKEES